MSRAVTMSAAHSATVRRGLLTSSRVLRSISEWIRPCAGWACANSARISGAQGMGRSVTGSMICSSHSTPMVERAEAANLRDMEGPSYMVSVCA